jgi:hypothetical protein
MENKEFYSIFPELGYGVFEEKIEKPLELNLHSNSVVSMNALNTIIANAIEKSKLGEAGFVKHDIFSSPALVEKICSDDILSPICDNSYDACAPHPFKIPMKIVERPMNNCYLGDGTVHPGDHLLFIRELCELFKCAGISKNQVKRKLFSLSLKGRAAEWYKTLRMADLLTGRKLYLSFILNSVLLVRFIKIGIIFIIFIRMREKALPKHGED